MERRIFDPRAGLWLLVAANIIAFRPHTLWLELALVGLLLLLMAAHGKYSMAVKWAVGYCALLLFQQYILPASPKIIATSFTVFTTYARRMFPCLMTGSLMLKCTPLRYFIVGLRQLRVPQLGDSAILPRYPGGDGLYPGRHEVAGCPGAGPTGGHGDTSDGVRHRDGGGALRSGGDPGN